MKENFFEHCTTHMQRVANCIQSMAEISTTLVELAKTNPSLMPTLLQVTNIFENTGEAAILIQSDLLEMARLLSPFLLSIPLETQDDTDAGPENTPPEM